MLKSLKSLLLFGTVLLCSFTVKSDDDGMLKTVVIDAGHGGKDPGTRGKISREKDIVLDWPPK
jgi:N-acetylmuramoyl-L-alanine amidase